MRPLLLLTLTLSFLLLNAADTAKAPFAVDFGIVAPEDAGVVLYDIAAKKEVFAHNRDKEFPYASNVKLITTGAALKHLGRNYTFKTRFFYKPDTQTLYMKTPGDPTMVMEELWLVANELKNRGVKYIARVVADDYAYGEKGCIPMEGNDGTGRAYNALLSPFALNYNSVELVFVPAKAGEKAQVFISTPGKHFTLAGDVMTVKGKAKTVDIKSENDNGRTKLTVSGTVGEELTDGVRKERKIWDPLLHYTDTLMYFLFQAKDIRPERARLDDSLFDAADGIRYTHESRELFLVLTLMNRWSTNFIADAIMYAIGIEKKGNPRAGLEILKTYAKELTGVEPGIINACGLGTIEQNLLTPGFVIELLKKEYGASFAMPDFFATLPVAGEEGTMKKIKADYKHAARLKTGSLGFVAAVSGVMRAKSGKLYLVTLVLDSQKKAYLVPERDLILDQLWNNF
ncbi:MAG TPA: D-alanyl-D-alanine carboxypeptidase/D-alanyl-D-alanine-endopeptidase [bacterium]|nr:D-alanyl-D-alanine carboxypeptidase/D-alanyl-D-alanine-endopeptidase [bacterium]